MRFPAFLFEVSDKMSSVGYMYVSAMILALLVFAATYFHRQFGLITLLIVSLLCAQDIEATNAEQIYIEHWNFSCRLTFVLSVILFFTAIVLKRQIKRKKKLN